MITCWLLLGLFSPILGETNFDWIFYATKKNFNSGDYDCLLYDQRLFCRRNDIYETRSCSNERVWYYSTLKTANIIPDVLLSWNIPFDEIEEYADYFISNTSLDKTDNFICNCTANGIGPSCQYEYPLGEINIAQTIQNQLSRFLEDETEILTCLVDEIRCNTGLLCLEWRQVCDGIIQCDDGSDEIDCHLLEFKQCNKDEYQCKNGMCIPMEFLFDATFDCMDASDEQEHAQVFEIFNRCPVKSAMECDERFCQKNQFSCGDGQCIHWSNLLCHRDQCKNLRDVAYHCEIIPKYRTFPTGICRKFNGLIPSRASWCVYNFLNILRGQTRKRSLIEIINHCPDLIQYPEQAILSPVVQMFFNKSRIVSFYNFDKSNFNQSLPTMTPDFICLNGSFVCNGTQTSLYDGYCLNREEIQELVLYPFFPIPYLFCHAALKLDARQATRGKSDVLWQSNEHGLQSYTCIISNQIISLRRVNDGSYDCLFQDDEMTDIPTMTELYRYRCLSSIPVQYVSYRQLGNLITECADGSDEISQELDWTYFHCKYPDDYGCWMLRNNRTDDVQILFNHHCNSVWNTMNGKDERNCTSWVCMLDKYQCKGTGQCIDPSWLCDGEYDCDNGEDEFNCSRSKSIWSLENQCDIFSELFCITSNFLSNLTHNRPCIDRSKIGDDIIDCLGGRDERNVFSCSDKRMLGDRFICDNETKCLAHTAICDGFFDCSDRTDELICFWNRHHCPLGQFACSDGKKCVHHRCDANQSCSDNEHFFWCPKLGYESELYRMSKRQSYLNYNSFCNGYSSKIAPAEVPVPVRAVTSIVKISTPASCNRGFFLLTRNGINSTCFCPPSYYGDRCQFNRRRITILVRVDRRYRSDIPSVLHVLVSLVCNRTIIVDHQTFVDVNKDFPDKHHAYLLYSRPRLKCIYSVRFEAYNGTRFLSFWQYLITPFDFLPVFRLTTILRFPDMTLPMLCSQNQCLNNGTCYVENINFNDYLCICQRGWKGIHCEKPLDQNECSSEALIRDQNICVCPYELLLPHCYIRNNICKHSNPCLSDQTCYALSSLPPNQYVCLCQSSECREHESVLVLHRSQPNKQPFLIQLLKMSSDYPRVRQQLIIEASSKFPVIRSIITYDIRKKLDGVIPEIGLLYKFEPQVDFVEIILNILYINCSNDFFRPILDLDTQLQQCYSLSSDTSSHSVKLYHTFCREKKYYPCFYSANYVCYCNALINRSECISHRQHSITCSHCINQGACVQGDLYNKSDFVCVCPKCVTGSLCQFSLRRFSISFEMLIEKTRWGLRPLISPLIFLFISLLLNGLSLLTFIKRKVRTTNIGLYLLLNTIISQLVIALLFTRVAYLIAANELTIIFSANNILCKVLPYLMSSLNSISLWLMAFVTVERAIAVAAPMKYRLLRTVRSTAIIFIVTCFIIFATSYIHIRQYKLIVHPDDSHPWCVQEIRTDEKQLIQYTSLAHQVIPFIVNLFAGLILIVVVSRSRATSRHLPPSETLISELRRRFDLLIGPAICFVTQLPQLVILFLDACDYEESTWFVHVTLVAYYISFTPQMSLLFMYILPSPLYKEVFLVQTKFGKYSNEIFQFFHGSTHTN